MKKSVILRILILALCALADASFAAEKEILVGASGGLTGPFPPAVVALRDGVEAYFKLVNEGGGVHGRKLRYLMIDDGFTPIRSRENAEKLVVKEKVFAMLGGNGTASVNAMLPYLTEKNVPLLFPFASSDFLYKPIKKNLFVLRPSTQQEGEEVVEYFVKQGKKKVGVFYQDDQYGTSARDAVAAQLKKRGLQITLSLGHQRGNHDVDRYIGEFAKAGVDAVILATNTQPSIGFIKGAAAKKYRPLFAGLSGASIYVLEPALKETGFTFIYASPMPLPLHSDLELVKEFNKDIQGLNNDQSTLLYALELYAGAKVFVEALRRMGPAEPTADGLFKALESMKDFDLGGLKVSFSPSSHQGLAHCLLYKMEDGKITQVK